MSRRAVSLLAALLLAPLPALAQSAPPPPPVRVVPLMPPDSGAPTRPPSAPALQMPPAQPAPSQTVTAPSPPVTAQPTYSWVPRPGAELHALDKVSTGVTDIVLRVGQTAQFGSLAIQLRACVSHAPDQPADSAAFLDITDIRAGGPGFHGWMFANEPQVAIFEHPVYDLRLMGCRN